MPPSRDNELLECLCFLSRIHSGTLMSLIFSCNIVLWMSVFKIYVDILYHVDHVSEITLYLILSYLILSYLILSYLILSYLILSYILYLISYILSYLILSYLILSYLILSYLILSYLILSYLILSYLILSYGASCSCQFVQWWPGA